MWREQPTLWYLSWNIIYEFLRVVTHPRVFSSPWTLQEAWEYVQAILASPSLRLLRETDRHSIIVDEIVKEVDNIWGNLVFDAHTAALMKEHGVRTIYTRDMDFHYFPFVEVKDPLAL
jgi:toxin-antitoxin system PIN domain toxin